MLKLSELKAADFLKQRGNLLLTLHVFRKISGQGNVSADREKGEGQNEFF